MGIDLLDVTYRIEEAFDITLSDDDYADFPGGEEFTVGDLYELILKKMHLRDIARYDIHLNYLLWLEVQRVLQVVTDMPLKEIELKTPLEALFPRNARRDAWNALRDATRYRLPELDYPKIVRVLGFSLAAAMAIVEQIQLWQLAAVNWLWPLLGLFGIWMLVETYLKVLRVCAPLRTSFPAGVTTVKDLCRIVLATNYGEICRETAIPFDERCPVVWEKLTRILVETLGVDASEVTFRSRLIHDLGMA